MNAYCLRVLNFTPLFLLTPLFLKVAEVPKTCYEKIIFYNTITYHQIPFLPLMKKLKKGVKSIIRLTYYKWHYL
jgi:hypothetical protein